MSRYSSFNIELTGALDAAQSLSNIPARILQAQKRALGTLRRRIATEAKRDIGAEYNLKAGRIAEGLSAQNEPDGIRLIGKSRGINAIQFGATWSRRMAGARYAFKRGGDRSSTDSTFIGVGLSNNRLVFARGSTKVTGHALHRVQEAHYQPNVGKWREPLRAIYGPSIAQMLKHGRRPERLAEFAIRTLQNEQQRLLGSK